MSEKEEEMSERERILEPDCWGVPAEASEPDAE